MAFKVIICSNRKVFWVGIRSLPSEDCQSNHLFQHELVCRIFKLRVKLIDCRKSPMSRLPVLCIFQKRPTCWAKLGLTRSDLRGSVSISLTMMSHEFHVVRMNSGDTTITVFNEFFNPYRMLCKIQGTEWTLGTPQSALYNTMSTYFNGRVLCTIQWVHILIF